MNTISRVKRVLTVVGLLVLLKCIKEYVLYQLFLNKVRKLSSTFPAVFSAVQKGPLALFGNFAKMAADFDHAVLYRAELFETAQKETGASQKTIQLIPPVFYKEITLATRDPEMIKHVTKTNFRNWVKPKFFCDTIVDIMGEGIFGINHAENAEGELWNFQRKTASMTFTKKNFTVHSYNMFLEKINLVKQNLQEKILEGKNSVGVVDMKKESYSFAMECVGHLACGVNLGTIKAKEPLEFDHAFDEFISGVFARSSKPWFKYLGNLMPSEVKLKQNLAKVDKMLYRVIKERRKQPAKELEDMQDILSYFLKADPERKFPDAFYRDMMLSFAAAGKDTTASLITSTLYLLSTHPHVQERLLNEVESMFVNLEESKESDMPNSVTFDMLKEMHYLDAIIFEVLRVLTPLDFSVRTALEADVLPNGVKVEAGTTVLVDIHGTVHDEKIYPEPYTFKPERFYDTNKKVETFDEYTYPIFLAGNRMCVGKNLAFYEAKVYLAELIRDFKFDFIVPDEFKNVPGFKDQIRKNVTMFGDRLNTTPSFSTFYTRELLLEVTRR